jgi:hypothetical protein
MRCSLCFQKSLQPFTHVGLYFFAIAPGLVGWGWCRVGVSEAPWEPGRGGGHRATGTPRGEPPYTSKLLMLRWGRGESNFRMNILENNRGAVKGRVRVPGPSRHVNRPHCYSILHARR